MAAILAIIVTIVVLAAKQKGQKGELLITDLSAQLNDNKQHFEEQLLSEDELKLKQKEVNTLIRHWIWQDCHKICYKVKK